MLNSVYGNNSVLSLSINELKANRLQAALIKSDSDESMIFRKGMYLLQKASQMSLDNKKDSYVLVYRYLDFIDAQLENYKAALKEHAETAVRVEPGVITLYAVYEKNHPTDVTVFEIYADTKGLSKHE